MRPYEENKEDEANIELATQHAASSHQVRGIGWKRLTIVLIVEAIALGALSLPQVFAVLGMVAGVLVCVSLGLIAIYTSWVVGNVKLKFGDRVKHYADAGRLLGGRFGYELVGAMFSLQLILLVGSHCLTGRIALMTITEYDGNAWMWPGISAVALLILAIPPNFADQAILGYIDFASIIIAIGIVMIATGIQYDSGVQIAEGIAFSAWPKDGITFAEIMVAIANILFAYSFAICQYSFMEDMFEPKDFVKSIWALGALEIVIYTLTGAIIYAFVGQSVESPALLSASKTVSKLAFGIALPVIFISGSINSTVVARYIHGRIFSNSKGRLDKHVNFKGLKTTQGRKEWMQWMALIVIITVVALIVAKFIPRFHELLAVSSSLFITGFTLYIPAIMWFVLLKEGSWRSHENLLHASINAAVFVLGVVLLIGGTYGSIDSLVHDS